MSTERESYPTEGSRIKAVVCDRCGKRQERTDPERKHWWPSGGTLRFSFEFGSLYDMTDPQYDLCDDCSKAVVEFIKGDAGDLENGWPE